MSPSHNLSCFSVMAIKSGPNAGRFLKKDDVGWLEVGDDICTDYPTHVKPNIIPL